MIPYTRDYISEQEFLDWISQAIVGDHVVYQHLGPARDYVRNPPKAYLCAAGKMAYQHACRGEVALFQRRVDSDGGLDYIAIRVSKQLARFARPGRWLQHIYRERK